MATPNGHRMSPTVELLSLAAQRIRSTPPRLISSPPTQPRRAAVSLILRVRPPEGFPLPPEDEVPTLEQFFEQEWVSHPDARAELLFIRRDKTQQTQQQAQKQPQDVVSGAGTGRASGGAPAHVAFPGGRTEASDEGALYTAMRQTWEEIGLDLAEREYTCIGQLDDREITTSLGKRLLMILSPFVFLHLSPYEPTLDLPADESDVSIHWVPISALLSPHPTWSFVTVDISSRLAPRHNILRTAVRLLVGNMRFRALVLTRDDLEEADDLHRAQFRKEASSYGGFASGNGYESGDVEELRIWGLTLGMTLDLIAFMYPRQSDLPPGDPSSDEFDEIGGIAMMPSMASVFPRFSIPDVNFWIWVFGRRYRAVLKAWEASVIRSRLSTNPRSGAAAAAAAPDRRINWSGQALSTFYAAVRKALVIVIVGRSVGILVSLGLTMWWVWKRLGGGGSV